jgi:hypothetical protein
MPAEAALPARLPPASSEPAPVTAEADFDPSDFLFGPEPEPEPAAFLLEPPSPPTTPPATATPDAPQPSAAEDQPAPDPAPPATAPHDPLRALKAMSPEERLAIFS